MSIENVATSMFDRILEQKLKMPKGRQLVAIFAATYCRDAATEVHDLNSSTHRLMLQRISALLSLLGDVTDDLQVLGPTYDFEGDVLGPPGPQETGSAMAMTNSREDGAIECGTYFHPLNKMLAPFDGRRVRLKITIEEIK